MRILFGGALAFALAAAAPERTAIDESTCAALAGLALPHATISMAQPVDVGVFTAPGAGDRRGPGNQRPFCRVAATLTPTSDSNIKIEVWLPTSDWNRKYQAVGNGAFSGSIAYPAMLNALARGYATSSTDTGHTGNTADFAPGHPEKVIDFGWRAVHEMTVAAKQIIERHYGAVPAHSYWNGCSAGGRQAMKEAQRFPADFDGIIAGAPGLDWTGRAAQAVRVAQALEKNPAARLGIPQTQLLHKAVLQACDARDGVTDGVVGDPMRCTFDPAVLKCKGGETAGCLTPSQAETAALIYSPVINAKTKREIAGLARGSELGWTELGWTDSARATGLDQFRYIVFDDAAWTIQNFNAQTDVARAEDADGNTINALDPDLKPFIDRGGKLIQYHGWADPQISPGNSVQYYTRVLEKLGGAAKVDGSYRLFMAPGMGHCGGGDGPNAFDMVTALEQWVEKGSAPDRIVASHSKDGAVDRTWPLCPYPQVAVHTGGTTDDAANFQCRTVR